MPDSTEFTLKYNWDNLTLDEKSCWDFYAELFSKAEITITAQWRLENRYWPECELLLKHKNPWWLMQTPYGLIRVGRRKRVWFIEWQHTHLRKIITNDEVTKSDIMVHAWDEEAFLRYLKTLKQELTALETENATG